MWHEYCQNRREMTDMLRVFILGLLLCASTAGQSPRPLPRIPLSQVKATLSWLASDALGGRGTPSPGLEKAAAWISGRFKKAHLMAPVEGRGYVFSYTVPGQTVSLKSVRLAVHGGSRTLQLVPQRDFRLYRSPLDGYRSDGPQDAARMKLKDAARRGLWTGRPIRRVLLVETPDDSALWQAREGDFKNLSRRRRRGTEAPVFLVREGLLPAGTLTVEVELQRAKKTGIKLKNVWGMVRGAQRPEEFVMVSAHYDHLGAGIPLGKSVDGIYNGADDDASGTTAVVELAELFAGLQGEARPARSILFVCFSGEEKGLLGSRALAGDFPLDMKSVVAQVNIEMIGRPEKGQRFCAWVTGASRSNFDEIAGRAFKRAGVKLVSFPMAEQLYYQSDNLPFARKGVVAHSISAGSLHRDYHKPSDEVSRIDMPHMTRIVNGLGEVVREFADRRERPRRTKK